MRSDFHSGEWKNIERDGRQEEPNFLEVAVRNIYKLETIRQIIFPLEAKLFPLIMQYQEYSTFQLTVPESWSLI